MFIPPVLSLPVFLLEVRAQRAHVKPRRLRRPFNGAPSAPLGASRHFHYNKLRAAVVDVLGSAWSINLVNACSPTVVHGILLKLQLFGTARPPSTTEGTTVNTTKQPLATRDNRSNKVLQQGGGALLKSPVEEPGAERRPQGTRLLAASRRRGHQRTRLFVARRQKRHQGTRLLGFNRVLQQGGGALLKRPVEEPGAEGRPQGKRLSAARRRCRH